MMDSSPCADRVFVAGMPPALFTSTSRRGFEARKESANVSTWVEAWGMGEGEHTQGSTR